MRHKLEKAGFRNGIHPDEDGKSLSSNEPVKSAPPLDQYQVIVAQNIGKSPNLVVAVGDEVKKGQLIAAADGFFSVNLHAPTSGKVSAIREISGPMGVPATAVEITADGLDEYGPRPEPLNWREAFPDALKKRIQDSGIVGMGGAAFPCHVKLSPPPDKKIDTLIINGAECEPYLTSDHRLMVEEPEKVLTGAAIMGKILGAERIFIGVELNKMDAIEKLLDKASPYNVKIIGLRVQYPQGAEKQLVHAVADRKISPGTLPMDAGCVVQNAGTAAAVAEAVEQGIPSIERITTVSGEAVKTPGNWRVKIGTPISKVIEWANGAGDDVGKVILGGPMMGFAQRSLDVTVAKNTSGILLLPRNAIRQYEEMACLRCGRCVKGCAMYLNPSLLATAVESGKFDLAAENHIMDCIECGSCAYVCPAHRPLVQHLRRGKAEIRRMLNNQKSKG